MERLISISNELISRVPVTFKRFLIDKIDWSDRLIGISGARGCGKTTLMLQYIRMNLQNPDNVLYVSLDDIYFTDNRLIYFAENFNRLGGKYLFLDEVHKYRNWSQEIKNIYDSLPDLKVVFTSSSALDIYRGSHDLSRRADIYHLPGLSFREFIEIRYGIQLPVLSLVEILDEHSTKAGEIKTQIKPLQYFGEYLEKGYYPYFLESNNSYKKRLINTVNSAIESDLPPIFQIDFKSVIKIKKMLAVIANIVPYKPNIQKLAVQSETTRDTLLRFLFYLDKANIVKWLSRDYYGINYLNKPEKLYLHNTNLMYALSNQVPDAGNLRETFFLNQLSAVHQVTYADQADFLVDNKWLFEVGGPGKQIGDLANNQHAFLAIDGIDQGLGKRIPLWLFGFLY